MGRSLDFLKQLSMKSGMPIVASCGYYAQPFYPPEIATMSEDRERWHSEISSKRWASSRSRSPKVEMHNATCKRGAFVGFNRPRGPGSAGSEIRHGVRGWT